MEPRHQKPFVFLVILLYLSIEIPGTHSEVRRNVDSCTKNPCYHGGICVQTSVLPGYKCRCFGTGFYGDRCQLQCTQALLNTGNKRQSSFPSECVVI